MMWKLVKKGIINFATQSYATYRGLFYWLTVFSYTSNAIFLPMLQMVIFLSIGGFIFRGDAMQNMIVGISIGSMSPMLMGGIAQSYTRDRGGGTIQFMFSSPANRLMNFVCRTALHIPNGLLCFTSSILAAWLIVGLDLSRVNWVGFALVVAVTSASVTMFASMVGVISIATREWVALMSPITNTLGILNGIVIPLSLFP
ncbi:MAG: ABC transporter permease, partial [Dehalococcoidales bacterium]|nr:ABC transporter permease [Dehalococcoidales bacterium]